MRRINGIYAAKTIEDADPAFKNSLINYLELRGVRGQMPKAIMATLEARAVSDLAQVEVDYGRQSAAIDSDGLRAIGRDRDLLRVRGLHAQEHSRLDPASVSGGPGAADQHAAGEHQAGKRPRAVGGGGRQHVAVLGRRARRPAADRSCCISASTAASFSPSGSFAAGRHLYDPWQVTLTNVQQSMDYYLTGGDAEIVALSPQSAAGPDDHVDQPRPRLSRSTPRSRREPTSRGEWSRRSKGRRSPSTPRRTCPPRRRTSIWPVMDLLPDGRSTPTIPRS